MASTSRPDQHQVDDRGRHPPGAPWRAVGDERREDRDERRTDGARGHQLVDEVRDPERREVRVELAVRQGTVPNDHEPQPAQQPRGQERERDDETGARESPAGDAGHVRGGVVGSDVVARGCAAR